MSRETHLGGVNIRDPIHGFIRLNEFEKELIQTRAFQRLRFIHQLGTSFWVYPTAQHTRFQHSLGVLYLAGRLLERLKLMGIEISKEDAAVFRTASLLHDIGHAPFSHVGEEMGLFRDGIDHEEMGERIIREIFKEEIEKRLGENAVDRIIFVIRGKERPSSKHDLLFFQLLAGQAGIDRMDYLIRDSYFLGVMYGRFDLERILETLRYNEEDGIFWEEGGEHALEQFLLARYFMFTEVYFHKTRRVLDFHLGEAMKEFIREKLERETFPDDPKEYLKTDDTKILSWISNSRKFSEIFWRRKFLKKIEDESSDHPDPEEIILWKWLEEEIKKRFDTHILFIDKAEKAPYKFEAEDVRIQLEGEKSPKPLEEASKLVKSLRPIKKRRIYTEEGMRGEVSAFVREFIRKNKTER